MDLILLSSVSQDKDCPAASQAKTYDANGFVASKTDWNGSLTEYVNNSRGLPESQTQAKGTAQERTVVTQWHAQYRLPTRIVAPGRTTELTYDAQGKGSNLGQPSFV